MWHDVPGAKLVHENVADHFSVQLQRWLKCRGLKNSGLKPELVKRYFNMDNQLEYSQPSPQSDNMDDDDADDVDSIYQFKASMHVMKALNDMRQNEEFCDLTIEMSNTKFQVHQTVMALWSPVLKNLLRTHEGSKQHVNIYYDKPDVFRNVLSFVYTGVFEDEILNIPGILMLATTFQIRLLQDLCVEHLKSIAKAENVISLYHLAVKYKLSGLKLHCVDVMRWHVPEVAQTQELRNLSPPQINFLLDSELVSRLDPEMKLCLIISWLTEDVSGRQKFLLSLLSYIDWSVAAENFLEDIRETDNIFISTPECLYLLLESIHASSVSLGPYEDQYNTLKEKHGDLPKGVASGRVAIGSLQIDQFKPVGFSLASHWKERDMLLENSSKVKVRKDSLVKSEKKKLSTANKTAEVEDEGSIGQPATESESESRDKAATVSKKSSSGKKPRKPRNPPKSRQNELLKCENCDYTSYDSHLLADHQKRVHVEKCVYCCDMCPFKSKWLREYNSHMKENHFKGPPFVCNAEGCDFSVTGFTHLVTHRRKHKVKPFACEICMKSFTGHRSLVSHLMIHSDERKFECPICHKFFKFKHSRDQHQVIHSDFRPYLCDHCGFSTKHKHHLASHRRIHSGKVFRCQVPNCGFYTPRKTLMTEHNLRHEGIRQYICSTCGKAFVLKSLLTQHERIHTGEKPHACAVCDYRSVRRDKLTRHYKKHHPEEIHRMPPLQQRNTCTTDTERPVKSNPVVMDNRDIKKELTVPPVNQSPPRLAVMSQYSALSEQNPGTVAAPGVMMEHGYLQHQTYLLESTAGNNRGQSGHYRQHLHQ